jgi:hypothetical protein
MEETKIEDPPLRSIADFPRKVLPPKAATEGNKKGNVSPREKPGDMKGKRVEGEQDQLSTSNSNSSG